MKWCSNRRKNMNSEIPQISKFCNPLSIWETIHNNYPCGSIYGGKKNFTNYYGNAVETRNVAQQKCGEESKLNNRKPRTKVLYVWRLCLKSHLPKYTKQRCNVKTGPYCEREFHRGRFFADSFKLLWTCFYQCLDPCAGQSTKHIQSVKVDQFSCCHHDRIATANY